MLQSASIFSLLFALLTVPNLSPSRNCNVFSHVTSLSLLLDTLCGAGQSISQSV
jgi:hypothetical protein